VRAVLDTNIAVAGLLWRGKPYELFGLTLTGRVLCFASDTLLAELERVLGYEKLARRIATLHTTIPELLAEYGSIVEIVPAVTISPTVIADPDDDHVLACAGMKSDPKVAVYLGSSVVLQLELQNVMLSVKHRLS
jgi:putative PIN family toxin of toxin-antitoxin system